MKCFEKADLVKRAMASAVAAAESSNTATAINQPPKLDATNFANTIIEELKSGRPTAVVDILGEETIKQAYKVVRARRKGNAVTPADTIMSKTRSQFDPSVRDFFYQPRGLAVPAAIKKALPKKTTNSIKGAVTDVYKAHSDKRKRIIAFGGETFDITSDEVTYIKRAKRSVPFSGSVGSGVGGPDAGVGSSHTPIDLDNPIDLTTSA